MTSINKKEMIAIDCTHLVKGRCGGFESYLLGLLDGLSQIQHPQISIFIMASQKKSFLYYESSFKIHEVNISNSFTRIFWQNFIFPFLSFKYSKLLFPANFRPLIIFRPSVTVIHDLQYRYHPNNWGSLKLLYRKLFIPFSILASTKIVAISNSVKQEIIDLLPMAGNKVEVIYNPIRLISNNIDKNEVILDGIEDYFLVPSSLAPHKNIYDLVEAIKMLGDEENSPKFIFTGHFSTQDFIDKYTPTSKIIVMGYVEQSLLSTLYKKCRAIVLPSFYEGFGMPYLEALKFNKPVIVSDIPIARELLGDAPSYISKPYTRQEIFSALLKYLESKQEVKSILPISNEVLARVNPQYVASKYLASMLSC